MLDSSHIAIAYIGWLGWLDLNQRMPESKSGALPLGYTPIYTSSHMTSLALYPTGIRFTIVNRISLICIQMTCYEKFTNPRQTGVEPIFRKTRTSFTLGTTVALYFTYQWQGHRVSNPESRCWRPLVCQLTDTPICWINRKGGKLFIQLCINKAVHQTPFTTAFYNLNALYFGSPNHHIKMNIQATIGIVAPIILTVLRPQDRVCSPYSFIRIVSKSNELNFQNDNILSRTYLARHPRFRSIYGLQLITLKFISI